MSATRTTRRTPGVHQQALVSVFRTADALRRELAKVIEPEGLSGQQYNVLRILRGAAPEPLPTMEIAARMMEQTPGITRLLDRLEAKGLVARERCGEDRRRVLCSITPEGAALVDSLDGAVDRADRELLGVLSDSELRRLIVLLERIREQAG